MPRQLAHLFTPVGLGELQDGDLFIFAADLYEVVSVGRVGTEDDNGDRMYRFDVFEVGANEFHQLDISDNNSVTLVTLNDS